MSYIDKIFILSRQYAIQKIPVKNGYKYYLFDTLEGDIYELNETSFDFLSSLNGKKKIIEVFDSLSKMYNININTLERDFTPLIEEWIKEGVITEKTKHKKGGVS